MREILFRGKRKDTGEWVEGSLITTTAVQMKAYIVDSCGCTFDKVDYDGTALFDWICAYEVDPETVGQYIELHDLHDKNGKKIFEGDICRFREWSKGDMCWIGEVRFEHSQFVISGNKNKECDTPFTLVMSRFISEDIEVIGNIHDNPELLD